jgi:chaperonin cofactor prefoldin
MLDNMTRKYALKLANTAIKYEYKTNGLDNLLPNVDKEILAKSLNDSGELVPAKLDELARGIDDIKIKQRYKDVSNKLKTLYAKSINDANPYLFTSTKII